MSALLGLALGGIAAWPVARRARRTATVARVRPLATVVRAPSSHAGRRRALPVPPIVGAACQIAGAVRARHRQQQRDAALRRELPVVVDLVRVAVTAGCTPHLAIEHVRRYGPAGTTAALHEVSRACALGRSLDDALRELGRAVPVLRPLAEPLRTSARLGSPAAPALDRLASEVRADVRRRAEARARTVPVRLCFPLVACVLPAFALLTVAPVVVGGLRG